jgi:hypothetical protein
MEKTDHLMAEKNKNNKDNKKGQVTPKKYFKKLILLFQKSLAAGVDCDYGRTILYLLYLLLCKEVKRLKVALCCYYGCRDMEGVLRCIKRY